MYHRLNSPFGVNGLRGILAKVDELNRIKKTGSLPRIEGGCLKNPFML